MGEAKRTPGPWHVEHKIPRIWDERYSEAEGTEKLGVPIVECRWRGGDAVGRAIPYAEADANAAFIVRAVNSHDALVAALEEARSVIKKAQRNFPPSYAVRWTHEMDTKANMSLVKIDDALSLAKGDAK